MCLQSKTSRDKNPKTLYYFKQIEIYTESFDEKSNATAYSFAYKTKCESSIFMLTHTRTLLSVYTNTCGLFSFYCCHTALVQCDMVTTARKIIMTQRMERERASCFSLCLAHFALALGCCCCCFQWYACTGHIHTRWLAGFTCSKFENL